METVTLDTGHWTLDIGHIRYWKAIFVVSVKPN